ncbi:hypothetical protein [Salmonella phage SD-1_S14]|nr:hypothetical protein [Salmonella phage SD-1_S14]
MTTYWFISGLPSSKQDVDFPLGLLQASVLLHVLHMEFFHNEYFQ